MSKYRTLAGQMQGMYGGGSTGSSSGVVYSGGEGGGVSIPKHADFWREIQNEIEQKIRANGGKENVQYYDEAIAQIEPFVSDSQYQADYYTLVNKRAAALQKQEEANFSATIALQNLEKRKLENQVKNFGNPNAFLTGLWNAYDESIKEIQTKQQDFAYNGLDTAPLDKALKQLTTDLDKSGDKSLLNTILAKNGDVSQMPGYAWQAETSPVDGSITGFNLVLENKIPNNFAFTNAEWAGRPVYVSKAKEKGQEYVPLQGHEFVKDETTGQWITDTNNFDLRKVKFNSYPTQVPVNGAARDTAGNIYYRGKDKWYKVDDPETLNSLTNTSGMGAQDYTNKDGEAYKSLPVLLDENVWSLGNFDNTNTLTKDQINNPTTFSQPKQNDPFNSYINTAIQSAGLQQPLMQGLNKIGLGVQAGVQALGEGVKATSNVARLLGQSIGPGATYQNLKTGREAVGSVASKAESLIRGTIPSAQTLGSALGSALGTAPVQPRKDLALQRPREEQSISNRAQAIFAGGRAIGRR